MSITVTLTRKFSRSGETITKNETITSDGVLDYDGTVDGSESDLQIDFSLTDPTLVKSIYMVASTDMTITPKNLAAASATPIELTANVAMMWSQSSGTSNPFDGANVATLHVANLDAADGTLSIRCSKDATVLTS